MTRSLPFPSLAICHPADDTSLWLLEQRAELWQTGGQLCLWDALFLPSSLFIQPFCAPQRPEDGDEQKAEGLGARLSSALSQLRS